MLNWSTRQLTEAETQYLDYKTKTHLMKLRFREDEESHIYSGAGNRGMLCKGSPH